ncbi:MAG TPA: dihydrodipicolinate synthase family protein [Acidimicrobiales bacterium]|jgi:4-hydroxy-tetrahydrodipicolinate synthase|nr:dihydrodipicolinate synthase family protein [Acidimicrobiales bacterium]
MTATLEGESMPNANDTAKTMTPGAFICTITCFDEDGELDLGAMRDHLERIGRTGLGAYIGTASPGEGHSLSLDETAAFYKLAAETLKGRAPVRGMGVEPRHANELMNRVRIAADAGLDAMQIYSVDMGHGNLPTQAELERYYRVPLEADLLPMVISAHQFSGYLPSLDVVDRLVSDYPHLIGFNVTSDLAYLGRIIDVVDDRVDIHVGGPMQALSVLAMGGQGFLCTEGNFAPKLVASVISAHLAGDLAARDAAYAGVMRFFALNRWPGGSVRFTKAVMKLLGLEGHHLRPPYAPLDADAHAEIDAALRALDAKQWL